MVSDTASRDAGWNGGSTGRPSAVFARAVAAHAQGHFATAVSQLRSLERDAETRYAVIDARHATLRGARAARAGNWTDCCDWYIRSPALPGNKARRLKSPAPCIHENCTERVSNVSGQCARWFCPAHGAEGVRRPASTPSSGSSALPGGRRR